jgi:hypothetical protein
MRATTYNATKGYEVRETAAGLGRAARVAKNVALFAAAPFIGLAYAVAFPFVAVGALAWFGAKALAKKG